MDSICAVAYGSEISLAMVAYARKENAEMIVPGIRRASAVAGHLPPQIAYRRIVTAPCPMLMRSYEPFRPTLAAKNGYCSEFAELCVHA